VLFAVAEAVASTLAEVALFTTTKTTTHQHTRAVRNA
jgi:hypothetical protein